MSPKISQIPKAREDSVTRRRPLYTGHAFSRSLPRCRYRTVSFHPAQLHAPPRVNQVSVATTIRAAIGRETLHQVTFPFSLSPPLPIARQNLHSKLEHIARGRHISSFGRHLRFPPRRFEKRRGPRDTQNFARATTHGLYSYFRLNICRGFRECGLPR